MMDPEAHYGPMPPQIPPSSLGMAGGGAVMNNPIMSGGNPYGHSVPPPPGLSSHLHPGGGPTPYHGGSGMGGGGIPKPLNTVQLQQLSAQIKAYRLLARNAPVPDALMSIAHGRKPTAAMIAQMYNQNVSKGATTGSFPQQPLMSSQTPLLSQSQRAGSAGNISSLASSQPGTPSQTGDSGGTINMYPPSPGVSQGHSPSTPRTLSSTSVSVAPNVTLPPGGELPLPVKQAMSSAQSVGTSTQPPHTTPHSSTAAPPSVSVPIPTSQPSHPPTQQQTAQQQQQSQQQQQQQQTKQGQLVKPVKLTPMAKPQGIDPTIIIQERETRYDCNVYPSLSFLLHTYNVYTATNMYSLILHTLCYFCTHSVYFVHAVWTPF